MAGRLEKRRKLSKIEEESESGFSFRGTNRIKFIKYKGKDKKRRRI